MSSLFIKCETVLVKLLQIPGFQELMDESVHTPASFTIANATDPVSQLWNCFRFGTSLCYLLNTLRPGTVTDVNPIEAALRNPNLSKSNVYHFVIACKNLDIPSFSISELYSDDTNHFVKVLRSVEDLLERIEREGIVSFTAVAAAAQDQLVSDVDPVSGAASNRHSTDPKAHREKVVAELLETERKYVNDLEKLQSYRNSLVEANVITKEESIQIFGNLNSLLDFERKFLIGLERECLESTERQHIGLLFSQNEEAFAVYGPFCSNHQGAIEVVSARKEDLEKFEGIIEPTRELASFLIKPIQRICRFPLLLKEMLRLTPGEVLEQQEELKVAHAAMERVTALINEERRQLENQQVLAEFLEAVEDWKGLKPQNFGQLLLHGNMIMKRRNDEKEVHMFLFESILICCKEAKKERRSRTKSLIRRSFASAASSASNGPKHYELKGRVAVSGIEGVISSIRLGNFDLKIFFKDAKTDEMESVVLRFIHEEPLKRWLEELEGLLDRRRRRSAPAERKRRNTDASNRRKTTNQSQEELEELLLRENSSASANSGGGLRIRVPHVATHISPLASPVVGYDFDDKNANTRLSATASSRKTSEDFIGGGRRPSHGQAQISLSRSQENPIGMLDKFLNDLEISLKQGDFEEDEEPAVGPATRGPAPPLPLPRERPAIPTSAPPRAPSLKVKVHFDKEIFVLLISATINFEQLKQRLQSKIGQDVDRVRYQDEDGDFITIRSDEDVAIAIRLCSAGNAMNIYV